MTFDFSSCDERIRGIHEWLQKEFATIRTGQASPALLDGVRVESYGTLVPLIQVASVGVEDARTLRISPWDKTVSKAIERAITEADFGVSVNVDDSGIRVSFPALTGERRAQLAKSAKQKLEEARVSVRAVRDETLKRATSEEKEGLLSKDDVFTVKEMMQKRIDDTNEKLLALYEAKEQEINN